MAWSDKLADMLRLNDGDQAYVGYPQMQVGLNQPRQAGATTGFLEGATGMPSMQPKNPITDPNYDAYAQGKNVGELAGIGAMAVPAYAGVLRAGAPKAYNALENYMVKSGGMIPLEAYHGTPHDIQGKFDISKVGTGEGAQHYGHGMYFAESPEVASTFKTTKGQGEFVGIGSKMVKTDSPQGQVLKDITMLGRKAAIKKYPDQEAFIKLVNPDDVKFEGGNLYKVDIPDEQISKTLDWYESFKNQPKDVQESLRNLGDEIKFGNSKESVADWLKMTGNLPPHLTNQSGNAIYNELAAQLGGAKQASEYLNNLGIKGIKYENFQVKKGAGANTNNYVMFDPSTVKILEENGKPLTRKEIIETEFNKK